MIKEFKILLIEENRILREGITSLLAKQQDIKVIDYNNAEDILLLINNLKPDIVLIDIELKYHNSLQLIKDIIAKYKDCKIVALDLIPTQADIVEYIKAGVLGFILKEADNTRFIKAIRKVARGLKVLPPKLTGAVFSQIAVNNNTNSKSTELSQQVKMTKREQEVIKLIADGLTNKEIAQDLNISAYTVKSHVHNILKKLSIHTRVHIAKFYETTKSNANADSTSSLNK